MGNQREDGGGSKAVGSRKKGHTRRTALIVFIFFMWLTASTGEANLQ